MFLLHGKVVFLGYVVSVKGIEVDEKNVKAIKKWPTPKSITKVRSFMVWLVFITDLSKISVR